MCCHAHHITLLYISLHWLKFSLVTLFNSRFHNDDVFFGVAVWKWEIHFANNIYIERNNIINSDTLYPKTKWRDLYWILYWSDSEDGSLHWLEMPVRVRFKLCTLAYRCLYKDSLLTLCPIPANLPRCTLSWNHLWHLNDRCLSPNKTRTLDSRVFYFDSL